MTMKEEEEMVTELFQRCVSPLPCPVVSAMEAPASLAGFARPLRSRSKRCIARAYSGSGTRSGRLWTTRPTRCWPP